MNAAEVWDLAAVACRAGERICLLVVVDREGSAPNGPGAKLVVTSRGVRAGTIGGGASEFQLVQVAEQALAAGQTRHETRALIHNPGAPESRSGMICGGAQHYVLMFGGPDDVHVLAAAGRAERESRGVRLVLSPAGFALDAQLVQGAPRRWRRGSDTDWCYEENLGVRDGLIIIGAGHVGLALSCVAAGVEFDVTLLDNRPGLATFEANTAARDKRIIDYAEVAAHVPEGPRQYVCIMTYGFRHDHQVLHALIHKRLRYLGMLGSLAKVQTVRRDLEAAGVPRALLDRVHAPIGVPIGSRTPEEIAISIAAELIRERRVGAAAWPGSGGEGDAGAVHQAGDI